MRVSMYFQLTFTPHYIIMDKGLIGFVRFMFSNLQKLFQHFMPGWQRDFMAVSKGTCSLKYHASLVKFTLSPPSYVRGTVLSLIRTAGK